MNCDKKVPLHNGLRSHEEYSLASPFLYAEWGGGAVLVGLNGSAGDRVPSALRFHGALSTRRRTGSLGSQMPDGYSWLFEESQGFSCLALTLHGVRWGFSDGLLRWKCRWRYLDCLKVPRRLIAKEAHRASWIVDAWRLVMVWGAMKNTLFVIT